jgi:hypothetical protein
MPPQCYHQPLAAFPIRRTPQPFEANFFSPMTSRWKMIEYASCVIQARDLLQMPAAYKGDGTLTHQLCPSVHLNNVDAASIYVYFRQTPPYRSSLLCWFDEGCTRLHMASHFGHVNCRPGLDAAVMLSGSFHLVQSSAA